MKKTAPLLNEETNTLGEPITCECIGCWADGTKTWEGKEDGNYYSLHKIRSPFTGTTHFYFVLEAYA